MITIISKPPNTKYTMKTETLNIKSDLMPKAIEILTAALGKDAFTADDDQDQKNENGWPLTYKQCCKATGTDPNFKFDIPGLSALEIEFHKAIFEWEIIRNAINGKWQEDIMNKSQYKYEPWVEIVKDNTTETGFAFSSTDCNYARTTTDVGSRLCFETKEKCLFALKYFGQYFIRMVIQTTK